MTFEAGVISARIQYLIQMVQSHLKLKADWTPDFTEIIDSETLSASFSLEDGTTLLLHEEYAISWFQLSIRHYAYIWFDTNGKQLLRADNAPHHRGVSTFPHHWHDFRGKRARIKPFHGQSTENPDIAQFFAAMRDVALARL